MGLSKESKMVYTNDFDGRCVAFFESNFVITFCHEYLNYIALILKLLKKYTIKTFMYL